jgi:hypothetical protein
MTIGIIAHHRRRERVNRMDHLNKLEALKEKISKEKIF